MVQHLNKGLINYVKILYKYTIMVWWFASSGQVIDNKKIKQKAQKCVQGEERGFCGKGCCWFETMDFSRQFNLFHIAMKSDRIT